MLSERLFYFIHGLCSMYFIMICIDMFRIKNPSRLQRILAYILLFWTILEIKDLAFYPFYTIRGNYISDIIVMIDVLGIPVGSIYLVELIKPKWVNFKRIAILHSVFIATIIGYAATGNSLFFKIEFIWMLVIVVISLIHIFVGVIKYNRMLEDNFSNTENINIDWLRTATAIMAACFVLWLVSTKYTSWLVDSLYYIISATLWGVIYHYTKKMEVVDIDIANNEIENEKETNMINSHDFQRQLTREIEVNEIYLNPKLTLSELAQAVGTNRTYLSNYLNSVLNTTFYDYINAFRLNRAIKMLEDNDSTATTTEIAEACGFNSLSTFRRVFVREKGCSFSQYKEQLSKTESNKI